MRTFNLLVLAILGLFITACDDDDHLGDWSKATQFSGAPRQSSVCFEYGEGENKVVFVGLGYGARGEEFSDMYVFENRSWKEVVFPEGKGFPADENPGPDDTNPDKTYKNCNGRHSAVAFVIGKYAYVGTGYVSTYTGATTSPESRVRTYFKDFYRFNMETREWDSKEDFYTELPVGALGRRDAVAFSDGTYGYVGTGAGENDRVFKDFYRFDPNGNGGKGEWTEIDFIGEARYGGTAFVINDAAYVCLGASTMGAGSGGMVYDVSKFDFKTKSWSPMQALTDKPGVKQDKDYPRIPRRYAVSFISDKGSNGKAYAYIATGIGSNSNTVWRYNHEKDQWHQMESLPSTYYATVVGAVGFTVDGYGFFSLGAATIDANSGFMADTWRFIPDVKEDRANDYAVDNNF